MRQQLIEELKRFIPYNEQEEKDALLTASLLEQLPDIYERTNLTAHMTASAWVLNPSRDKVLMAYHNLYDSWAWLGGHADGCEDLLGVAMKEVREESGIETVSPLCEELFSVEILTVDGHEKRGAYVPSHLHLNVTYLLEADDSCTLHHKQDENSAVGWFSPEEAVARSTEPWFQERIYKKLNEKLKKHLDKGN